MNDNIKNSLSRKAISKIYGKKFTDFAFDEIANSYPSIKWSLENGGKEEDFFGLIYPWFFPRKNKSVSRDSEWDSFHDKKRKSKEHYVLYPKNNGFQGFVDAIIKDINMDYCTIKKNVKKLEINTNPKTNDISNIKINNKLISGDLYFWCASPISLVKTLKINLNPSNLGLSQKIIFGNFVFENSIKSNFHEILVGSLEHKINRISFPGKIMKNKNNLIQVEFAFPEIRGFISKYNLQHLTNLLEKQISKCIGSNIVIPAFNLGPENINRVIPEVILNTISSIAKMKR